MTSFDLVHTPIEPGRTLIEASAGTGKTFTLTAVFARLMIEHGLDIDEILVCTFTEAATAELRERLRAMLVEAVGALHGRPPQEFGFLEGMIKRERLGAGTLVSKLERALRNIDQAAIFTIHGFCQRLLQDRSFESGNSLQTSVLVDDSDVRRETVQDFWRRHAYSSDQLYSRLLLTGHPVPESLSKFINGVFRYPEIQFERQGAPASAVAAFETWRTEFEQARAQWASCAKEVENLLTADFRWGNQGFSKPEAIRKLLKSVDEAFHGGDLRIFEEIGTSQIEAHINQKRKLPPPRHAFFDQCDRLAASMDDYFEALGIEAVTEIREEMVERKRKRRLIGFSDMLEGVDRALNDVSAFERASLRGKWRAVLIDEFQDTDPVQDRIFRRLFDPQIHWIFLIGDPKQAIYGFRGADLETYLKTAEVCDRQYSLGTNRRSEKRLVEAVNALFSVSDNPFEHEKITFRPATPWNESPRPALTIDDMQPRPLVLWTESSEAIHNGDVSETILCETVALESKRLLEKATVDERRLRLNEIAVLTGTNSEAVNVQKAFQRLGIPAVVQSGRSIFQSAEAEAVSRLLAAVLEPRRGPLWRAALATSLFGTHATEIAALDDDTSAATWAERFQEWHVLWRKRGFSQMFSSVLDIGRTRERLSAERNGERALTNFLHLAELLHGSELSEKRSPGNLLRWLDKQLAEPAGGEDAEAYEQRLETESEAVQVMTVHRSKGLEFPVVFVPFAWRRLRKRSSDEPLIYHDKTHGLRSWIHRRNREVVKERAIAEELCEKLRLLYVAVTRAKQRCYVTCHPGVKNLPKDSAIYRLLGDNAAQRLKNCSFISVEPLPDVTKGPLILTEAGGKNLAARTFLGKIRRDWGVASFTGLSHALASEEPDRDEPVPLVTPEVGELPGGTNVGTCLHEVLEKIDFQYEMAWPEIVRKALRRSHLDRSGTEGIVLEMLQRIAQMPLDRRVTLDRVPKEDQIQEMEFMLPLRTLTVEKLRAACKGAAAPIDWDRLSFPGVRGMLKGYIDLVIRHRGKFYLVDWKSNLLSGYDSENILSAMKRGHYGLQYLLYCVALRRQLSERISGFNWDRDFGGVRYVFLRGGMFGDKPSGALIERLSALF
ncbi:MAG TPA: exodeoxyribonuclease V subunit beta [Chthoniobacterales bacterium]